MLARAGSNANSRKAGRADANGRACVIRIPAPSATQWRFLQSEEKYLAFGGARGGGKSWCVRVKALTLALKYPGIKIMIVRRTYPELRANHILPMMQMVPPAVAKFNESKKELTFSGGSMILYRYCESDKDMVRYQGTEVDVLFIDEATQLTEEVFQMFKACVRGVNAFPKRIYLTCNPGGVGHGWVKRLFVDRVYKTGERAEDYEFIQSKVTDNKALLKAQPEYIEQLMALPPKLRDAWLYGDWDIFEGQYFEEFRNAPNPERRMTHVIAPFDPPRSWPRYRSYDWGYSKPFSCGWWTVDPDGRYYRILELYGCTETANEGVKWTQERQFAEIARTEREHPWLKGLNVNGVADPAIWGDGKGTLSTADIAAKQGVYFEKGQNDRISGWMQMHYRLSFDSEGYPMLYVFEGCKAFIRTIPLLCYDDHIPEDLDTDGEDHVADECRYFCMTHPLAAPRAVLKKQKPYDPLDLERMDQQDPYEFYRR